MKFKTACLSFILFLGSLSAQTIKPSFHQRLRASSHVQKVFRPDALRQKSAISTKGTLDSVIYEGYIGTPPEWMPGEKEAYEYDQNGHLILSLYGRWSSELNQWIPISKYEMAYDEAGNLINNDGYEYGDAGFTPVAKEIYVYNEHGLIQEVTVSNYSFGELSGQYQNRYVYDTNNFLASNGIYTRNTESETWVYQYKNVYKVDSEGRIIDEVINDLDVNNDGVINSLDSLKYSNSYDENGNLVKASVYAWNTSTNGWYEYNKSEYTYENSLLTNQKYYYRDQESEFKMIWNDDWTYDQYGNTSSYILRDLDEDSGEWEMEKNEYRYDLNAFLSDYSTPNLDGIRAVNKLIEWSYYYFTGNDWNLEFGAKLHYSDDLPSSVTSIEQAKILYAQGSKKIQFFWDSQLDNLQLEVYNISGGKVLEQGIVSRQTINMESLSNGIYLYKLTNKKQIASGKIILK